MYENGRMSVVDTGNEATLDLSGEELYNYNGIRIIAKGIVEDSFKYIDSGAYTIVEAEFWSNNFEDADIDGIDDIENVEIILEIRDEYYNLLDEAVLYVEANK